MWLNWHILFHQVQKLSVGHSLHSKGYWAFKWYCVFSWWFNHVILPFKYWYILDRFGPVRSTVRPLACQNTGPASKNWFWTGPSGLDHPVDRSNYLYKYIWLRGPVVRVSALYTWGRGFKTHSSQVQRLSLYWYGMIAIHCGERQWADVIW